MATITPIQTAKAWREREARMLLREYAESIRDEEGWTDEELEDYVNRVMRRLVEPATHVQ